MYHKSVPNRIKTNWPQVRLCGQPHRYSFRSIGAILSQQIYVHTSPCLCRYKEGLVDVAFPSDHKGLSSGVKQKLNWKLRQNEQIHSDSNICITYLMPNIHKRKKKKHWFQEPLSQFSTAPHAPLERINWLRYNHMTKMRNVSHVTDGHNPCHSSKTVSSFRRGWPSSFFDHPLTVWWLWPLPLRTA